MLTLISNTYGGSLKEEYELQERCDKSAAIIFKKKFVTSEQDVIVDYQAHYNKNLNKCFMLVTRSDFKQGGKKGRPNMSKSLIDIHEHKEIACFFKFIDIERISNEQIMECNVAGKKCLYESEWDELVKPYMEE